MCSTPSTGNLLDRVIDTLSSSHGSANPAKPDLSPHPEKRSSYKHKRFRASLLVLVFLVLTAVLPIPAVFADGDPGITLGAGAVATGNQIYFGSYDGRPVLWRVMVTGNAGSGILLLSEYLLDRIQFNQDLFAADAKVWQESTAQKWCGDFYSERFTAAEKLSMIQTSKTDAAYEGSHSTDFGTSSLENENIFFLSAEEAETYSPIDNDESRKAYFEGGSRPDSWWLRSPTVNMKKRPRRSA